MNIIQPFSRNKYGYVGKKNHEERLQLLPLASGAPKYLILALSAIYPTDYLLRIIQLPSKQHFYAT